MTDSERKQRVIGILMVLCTAVLWSTAGFFIKIVPWNALVIGGWRGLVGAVVLFAYMKARRLKITVNGRSLLVGLAVAVTSLMFIAANKLTTAANAIVLQYTAPIFLVIFSAVFFKKKFRLADYLAVGVTVIGTALFFMDELSLGGMTGNLLALADGATLACMYMLTGESDEATRLSGIMMGAVISFVVGAPLSFVFETAVTGKIILCIIAMGLLQVALPYILYSAALKRCPPLACSLIGSTEIIMNPVWALLILGEVPGKWALVGGVIILVTITLWCALDIVRSNKTGKPQTAGGGADAPAPDDGAESEGKRPAE